MTDCTGKSSWPELVGVEGEKAVKIIEEQNPTVTAQIVIIGVSIVTPDFRCDRVWVWVDKDTGIVGKVPQIG
ncbi:inhibitor of trypsin and hageman factor-like [Canna indica]|uniref:Inhibitor of trypsin and hageman factor-like n=1 Tax=Canna indica TaxID=4628 RepID=A0AAQ3KY65_9LILI|nr:inhibitor of trypsin and hageman factor-like [Canna indica]